MVKALVVVLILALAGCASTAERLADKCYVNGGLASVSFAEGTGKVECRK